MRCFDEKIDSFAKKKLGGKYPLFPHCGSRFIVLFHTVLWECISFISNIWLRVIVVIDNLIPRNFCWKVAVIVKFHKFYTFKTFITKNVRNIPITNIFQSRFFLSKPFDGKLHYLFLQILSLSSPEEELEVLVKLLDGKDLLDQQTLLITEQEGVFQFMPINTEAEELTVEVSQ